MQTRPIAHNSNAWDLLLQMTSNVFYASNNTKSIVLQKAFELLRHRKPSPPPKEHEETFEQWIDAILEQVGIQNHEGQVLADQCRWLETHLIVEEFLSLKIETNGIMLEL
ncbi:hypothetical protein CAEBREN_17902 [Caenorhabditis brenneri]|uniref:Uncharacterized protein n=1 Tax=Caenorhabditis brenneri TaxID=135651 RepID=G0MW33_CAEBE|nr:hypothetical protein CAEBREN_17902 [Caenorhabditis brenneri]